MELYRVKELIELATAYMQIGYTVLDAILKAEKELTDVENIYITYNY